MIIHFKRHFKVDFTWFPSYNSTGFNLACKEYDSANIIITTKDKRELIVHKIYRYALARVRLGVDN